MQGLARYEKLEHELRMTPERLGDELFGSPDPVVRAFVACDDVTGAVVGCALWWYTFSTFLGVRGIWLEDLFVRPEARGAGHGLALLQALRDACDGRVEWSVLDWNESAIGFYRNLGARPIDGWTTYRWLPDSAF